MLGLLKQTIILMFMMRDQKFFVFSIMFTPISVDLQRPLFIHAWITNRKLLLQLLNFSCITLHVLIWGNWKKLLLSLIQFPDLTRFTVLLGTLNFKVPNTFAPSWKQLYVAKLKSVRSHHWVNQTYSFKT